MTNQSTRKLAIRRRLARKAAGASALINNLADKLPSIKARGIKFKLITPYWETPDPSRNEELWYCEKVNKQWFDVVHMPEGRPTYKDLFSLCQADYINVVANSDIYFDETLELCRNMRPEECYALSRYDRGEQRATSWSQDAWIFRGEVSEALLEREIDFNLGLPGCDHRIAYEISKAGYKIKNPCLSIKAHHKHESQFRTYTDKNAIKPPYMQGIPKIRLPENKKQ